MKTDPVTGPLTREEFTDLVAAPFGEATKRIRKHDPLYGRKPGEKFTWIVRGRMNTSVTARVEAADQKEADKLADDLNDAEFDVDGGWDCEIEIESVEPDKRS